MYVNLINYYSLYYLVYHNFSFINLNFKLKMVLLELTNGIRRF